MITVKPYTLTGVNDSEAFYSVGIQLEDTNGDVYEYRKVDASSANAASAGRVFYYTSTGTISDDYSAVNPAEIAGIGIGTVTKGNYGFILKRGNYTAALKDSSVVSAGCFLVPSSTDGKVAGVTIGQSITVPFVGIATAPKTTGDATVGIRLNLC